CKQASGPQSQIRSCPFLPGQGQVQSASKHKIRQRCFRQTKHPLARSPHAILLLNRQSRPRYHAQRGNQEGLIDLGTREQYCPHHGGEASPQNHQCQFHNQGGSSFIVPSSTFSSDSVAEILRPLIGDDSLNQRVRIAEYNQNLPPKNWRVQLDGKVMDDFTLFSNVWKELETASSSIILAIDFDRLVQVYGDDLMLPSLANIGARMRDAGAVTLAVASDPNKITEAFLRTADYYL